MITFWSDGLTHKQKLEEAHNRYGREFKQVKSLQKENFDLIDKGRDIPYWLLRKD